VYLANNTHSTVNLTTINSVSSVYSPPVIGNHIGPTSNTYNNYINQCLNTNTFTSSNIYINVGSSVYVKIHVGGSKIVTSVKDSLNNTYTKAGCQANGTIETEIWYRDNVVVVAGNIKITVVLSGSAYATMCVTEIKSCANPSLDSISDGTCGTSYISTDTITCKTDNTLCLMSVVTTNDGNQYCSASTSSYVVDTIISPSPYGQNVACGNISRSCGNAGSYTINCNNVNTSCAVNFATFCVAIKGCTVQTLCDPHVNSSLDIILLKQD
jgi:hypothetical protein